MFTLTYKLLKNRMTAQDSMCGECPEVISTITGTFETLEKRNAEIEHITGVVERLPFPTQVRTRGIPNDRATIYIWMGKNN